MLNIIAYIPNNKLFVIWKGKVFPQLQKEIGSNISITMKLHLWIIDDYNNTFQLIDEIWVLIIRSCIVVG